ncbi:MAG: hypothetical protein R3F14_24570 [Polyangiaceae bacterium]
MLGAAGAGAGSRAWRLPAPPPQAPVIASASPGTSSQAAPSADPLEALHDAEVFPPFAPSELAVHRIEMRLVPPDVLSYPLRGDAYVSEDGAIAFVLQETGGGPEETVLQWRSLDGKGADRDIVFLDGPPCSLPSRSECPRPKAKQQVKEINKLLAGRRWVQLREHYPWPIPSDLHNCGGHSTARHFRVPGYEISYREPHLKVTRAKDGKIIVDDPAKVASPGKCESEARTLLAVVGLDLKRRAMAIVLERCHVDDCLAASSFFFYRLPPE